MIYVYILCSLEQPELISSFESDRQKTSIGLRRIRETAKPIARHRLTEVIATDAVKRARIHYGIAAVGFDHNQTHRLLAASTTRQEGSNLVAVRPDQATHRHRKHHANRALCATTSVYWQPIVPSCDQFKV